MGDNGMAGISDAIHEQSSSSNMTAAQAAHLIARLGRLLLLSGADTAHTVMSVTNIARRVGHNARVLVTPQAMLVMVGAHDRYLTKVGQEVGAPGVDMGRLFALERIIDEVEIDTLDAAAIDRRIDAVETSGGDYPLVVVTFGLATTTGCLSILFGSSAPVAAAAFVAGMVSAWLRKRLLAFVASPFVVTFTVAVISGLIAVISLRLTSTQSPILALTAAGMILVPGVSLINAIREIASGHADNGIARLANATGLILLIAFALYIVGMITGAELPVDDGPGALPVGVDAFFAGLAAAGFALLFNVPPRAIIFCIVAGAVGHGLRTALQQLDVPLPLSSFVGALMAAVVALLAGRFHRVPPVVFAFPGVVAMIPGSYGFRAGIAGLQVMELGSAASATLVATTLGLAITTAVTTIAIGLGLALPLSGFWKATWFTNSRGRENDS